MLFLVVLLFIFPRLNVAGINLTYMVKNGSDGIHPSCVAEDMERYAAIGWVYPFPESPEYLPIATTRFIPTIENGYNCRFQKNSICTARWTLRNWKIDDTSLKTKEIITDTRWEDLPTIFISNTSKEFEHKVELDNVFKTGFSVRADGLVEILICSGPNPYENTCYYFHIGYREIYFKVFTALPKDTKAEYKNNHLEHYKAYSNILSPFEWRNFMISSSGNGQIRIADVNLNRTLIEHTAVEPLNPMYMFMRSANNSLWKIHQTEFLFTNTTQISRLGPQLSFSSKDLCVSLLVSTCSNCEMKFFYQNGKILKIVGTKNGEWTEVKLKDENVPFDTINIFVETKFVDKTQNVPGFWAIDDVRVCHENEVKLTRLKFTKRPENLTEESISCQSLKKPSFKPKKLTYGPIGEFPDVSISSKTNSFLLNWKEEDPLNPITYFVSYRANLLNDSNCSGRSKDLNRMKSNGFLRTDVNELVLENVVPYTTYAVTIWTAVHAREKSLLVTTQPTVDPTLEELPLNIQIKPSQTSVNVSWDKVDCSKKFGHLFYQIVVGKEKIKVEDGDANSDIIQHHIDGLKPNKHYSFVLETSRSDERQPTVYPLQFVTLPGVAPTVENLELYSIDSYSASLRYELPPNPEGVVSEVQVTRCNSLSLKKCRSTITPLRPCNLWPGKFCVEVNYLIPHQAYFFKVAVKNRNTPTFGKETSVRGIANERVPGKPTNVTYKMVDCQISNDFCPLNISWLHPYDQNGTITFFEIILNNTDQRNNIEDPKYIHEVYKIDNKSYYREYTYQVKPLPFGSHYDLQLRSANSEHYSAPASAVVTTDNLGDHLDQRPRLVTAGESSLLFAVPRADRRLQRCTLTVVVQDYERSETVPRRIADDRRLADKLCHSFGRAWVSQVVEVQKNESRNIIIGNSKNETLKPSTKYCIIFIITNQYKGSEHDVVYYARPKMAEAKVKPTESASSTNFNHLYMLLLLLLLIPIGFLLYRFLRKKRVLARPVEIKENVYESIPHDDCELTETQSDVKNPSFSNSELRFT